MQRGNKEASLSSSGSSVGTTHDEISNWHQQQQQHQQHRDLKQEEEEEEESAVTMASAFSTLSVDQPRKRPGSDGTCFASINVTEEQQQNHSRGSHSSSKGTKDRIPDPPPNMEDIE